MTPFDETFLNKLSVIKLLIKKTLLSGLAGEKSLRQRGGKLEFSEYRDYAPGDETRYIDWNVFGRSEKLFVKEFAREESAEVYLILDLTASMGSPIKIEFAKQLAVALGYVSLVAGHRLHLIGFSGETLTTLPEFHRENDVFALMKFLEPLEPKGETRLNHILEKVDKETNRKGLIIFISDLMHQVNENTNAGEIREEFRRFTNRGFDVNIIHLLTPAEIEPPLTGWVKLRDAETNKTKTVFINQNTRTNYDKELNRFIEDWQSFCLKHNIRYFNIKTDTPLETIILDFLRKGGLLK